MDFIGVLDVLREWEWRTVEVRLSSNDLDRDSIATVRGVLSEEQTWPADFEANRHGAVTAFQLTDGLQGTLLGATAATVILREDGFLDGHLNDSGALILRQDGVTVSITVLDGS